MRKTSASSIIEQAQPQLHRWKDLLWEIRKFDQDYPWIIARCPSKKCACELQESKIENSQKYRLYCVNCGYEIELNTSIDNLVKDFMLVYESASYQDAEIINLDGELVRLTREKIKDPDYWIDAKLSKNKKGEIQLMVLAGSKKEKDKAQLFIEPNKEKLGFDQNNDHPNKIFSKVVCTFKNSVAEMKSKDL